MKGEGMKKVAWVLVGLLVGVLIATAVPVGAHHSRSARRLANRVERLEIQMAQMRNKTSLMDADGFYFGPVLGYQVLSECAIGTSATWEQSEVIPELAQIDDCIVGQQKRAQVLQNYSR